MAKSYTLTGPTAIDCGAAGEFVITLDAPHGVPATITPGDGGRGGVFAPSSVVVPAGSLDGAFTYTPRNWGRATLAATNDAGLADPPGLAIVAGVAIGKSGTLGETRCPDMGGYFPSGAWWEELSREITADPVHPMSATMVGRYGSANCKLEMYPSDGKPGGASYIGMPYNVVPGDQPLKPISILAYKNPDQPKVVPFHPTMSIEGWRTETRPPKPGEIPGDHHAMVYERDESTGGARKLHEYNRVDSADGGETWTAIGGATFDLATGAPGRDGYSTGDAAGLPVAPLMIRYDEVARGEIVHPLRVAIPGGYTTAVKVWPARAIATGTHPIYVVATADAPAGATTVAIRPLVALTWTAQTMLAGSRVVFPCSGVTATLVADAAGGVTALAVGPLPGPVLSGDCATIHIGAPFGARFRLKKSWYEARRESYLPNVRVVLDALRTRGGINADGAGGGFYLNGVNDARWTVAEIGQLRSIPVSAFEVVTPPDRVSFKASATSVEVGQAITLTLRHIIPGDSRFAIGFYFHHAIDPLDAASWSMTGIVGANPVGFDDARRGPYSVTYTPKTAGMHYFRVRSGARDWAEEDVVLPVLVTDPDAPPIVPVVPPAPDAPPAIPCIPIAGGILILLSKDMIMTTLSARVRRRTDGQYLDPTTGTFAAAAPAATPLIDLGPTYPGSLLLPIAGVPDISGVDVLISDADGKLVGQAAPSAAGGQPVVVVIGGVAAFGAVSAGNAGSSTK